jgi:hypothetical protein
MVVGQIIVHIIIPMKTKIEINIKGLLDFSRILKINQNGRQNKRQPTYLMLIILTSVIDMGILFRTDGEYLRMYS